MAEHGGTVEFHSTGGDDFPAHQETYLQFLGIAKYGTIAVVILLVLMAMFLV